MEVLGTSGAARPSRREWAWLAALLAAASLPAPLMAQVAALETAVKATYLYKFVPFVEWPASAFATATSPLYVCVLGDAPFSDMLESAIKGQQVAQRPVAVRRLEKVEGPQGCHILYAANSAEQSAADALRLVRGAPVLTVTDRSRGVGGGVIQFVVKDGRVRFDIDQRQAAAQRVVISSKLLSLAVSARRRG